METLSSLGWTAINETYHALIREPDQRVNGWFLMGSINPVLLLAGLYLAFVQCGPCIMRNRPAFDLRAPMIVYSFGMAAISGYMVWELFWGAWDLNYSYMCQPMTYVPGEMRIVKALYLFYLTKGIEFIDTGFIILRKKERQLTFLHVYHHTSTLLLGRMGLAWAPSGSAFQAGLINSLVHLVMYTYYGFAALKSERFKRVLSLKKYITKIQLIQFVYAITNALIYFTSDCDFPAFHYYLFIPYMITMIILFSRFHSRTYSPEKLKDC